MSKDQFLIVAIDGGAASGKSSTSRGLRDRFGLMRVDTGSFYRSITLKLLEAGIEAQSNAKLNQALEKMELETEIESGDAMISIDGWTPDESIRSERINHSVSDYAALPEIRERLLQYQRNQKDVAQENGYSGLIMEGRDIGSVIFPDANVKLFLDASPEARASRRAKEGIVDSMEKRDRIDSTRKTAPLKRPEGSILIDSSEMSLEEVIDEAAKYIEAALNS